MLEVTSIDHNGRGIAKLNGKIVFINNALPGEIVDINIIKEKKNFIEADIKKIIKPSKKRIDSACPFFPLCGGCDIMHLSYDEQLIFKQQKIENIINKYLDINVKINKIVKCNNEFNYRNKITFQVKNKIGLYKRNSYEIVPLDNCLISNNIINQSIPYLNKLKLDDITKIMCRTNGKDLMIVIETKNKDINIDCLKEISNSIYLKYNNKYIKVFGDDYIIQNLDKYKYIVSPDSFFQVNLDTCLNLYNKIKEYVGTNNKILDLYCGTGSIGLHINEGNKVLGIELNKFAVEDANKNKELNNIKNTEFICGDSGETIKNLKFKPNIIVVDPPRSGLNNTTINNIFKFKPNKIIYVSCDPLTLVRDLNKLKERYNIIEITPFDMFPQTFHVECMCILEFQ